LKFKQVSAKQSVFATCWRPLFLENHGECPKNYPLFETTRQKNPQAILEKADIALRRRHALNKTRKIGYKISKKRYTPVGDAGIRILGNTTEKCRKGETPNGAHTHKTRKTRTGYALQFGVFS